MSLIVAKIEDIRKGILLRDTGTNEVLENDSPVWDGMRIQCFADEPLYNTIAYRIATAPTGTFNFTPALAIRLDLPSGHGRRRADSFAIEGTSISIKYTDYRGLVSEQKTLRNLQRREQRNGTHFTFEGKVYFGFLGTNESEETLEVGGVELNSDRMLICSREQFGNENPIKRNKGLKIAQTDFRVDRIEITPTAIVYTLQEEVLK